MDFSKESARLDKALAERKRTIFTMSEESEKESKTPAVTNNLPSHDTQVLSVIKQEEQALLGTQEVKDLGRRFSQERIKSDLSAEASRIREKNLETAEHEFENETRELRLKHNRELLKKQHYHEMQVLEQDAKHSQMLNNRRKLVEKYGYLYNQSESNLVKYKDGNDKEYLAPRDFSYSPFVNKLRQFGRNVSKLDKPLLQTLKWGLIIGGGVLAIFLLKHFGILN